MRFSNGRQIENLFWEGDAMQLTVPEAAQLLHVSEETIYKWIRKENLPALEFNGRFFFHQVRLIEWANRNHIAVSVESALNFSTLEEAFLAGNIHQNIAGTTVQMILRSIVEQVHLPQQVSRDFLYHMLLTRKQYGFAVFGNGIAIPRARSPIVLQVEQPSVSLFYLKKTLNVGARDGLPLQVLFLLITPTFHLHLHLLARLGRALLDSQFVKRVLEQADRPTILESLHKVEALQLAPSENGKEF